MVVDDLGEALRRVADGESVVLLVDVDAPLLGELPAGPGRLAIFVGSPSDPRDWEAAGVMAAELFGLGGSGS
jgi:ABC-type sugar transport system substrate-binding protein